MLDLFESEGVNTTFILNGNLADRLPEIVKEIKDKGHEIAIESYIHDYNYMKTKEEEKLDLQKCKEAIAKVLGEAPKGYLSMGVQPTENTPGLLVENGFKYWMDLQHDEIPYTLQVDNKDLVALSYYMFLNDYSSYSWAGRTPRELLELWKDCFDYLYEEGKNGSPKMMIWGFHAFLTGRPFRAKVLREFIRYAKGHPKVWFARSIDIAEWWLENYRDSHLEKWPNALRMVDPPLITKASMVE
jgi:peptidoglycan/xylan/chitin deacetylase (PgdA/CDA1 family)